MPTEDYVNLAINTTDPTEGQASTYQELVQETMVDAEYSTLDEITPSTEGQAHNLYINI